MKIKSLLAVTLLVLASASFADSPSSVAARDGINPSTVRGSGDFDFSSRDHGRHSGWEKGEGHRERDRDEGRGHRNHDCNDDGPLTCTPPLELFNGQCLIPL